MGILDALSVAGQLFGGLGGSVTLGPIVLADQEVPERIGIGGKQMLAAHKYPGGQRTFDVMGRDDRTLDWSGIMFDGALGRARYMDSLRVAGVSLTLAWGVFSYTVLIESFEADYQRDNWIPYSISCQVVSDNSAQFTASQPSLLDSINNDVASATGYSLTTIVNTGLAATQVAMALTGSSEKGSAGYVTVLADLSVASGALASLQSVQDTAMGGLVGLASGAAGVLPSSGGAVGAVTALGSFVTTGGMLANAVQANGFIGRALTNLTNASA